jgi:hypothetical protein
VSRLVALVALVALFLTHAGEILQMTLVKYETLVSAKFTPKGWKIEPPEPPEPPNFPPAILETLPPYGEPDQAEADPAGDPPPASC